MIEPIEGSKSAKQNFVVSDIENREDGSILAIGTSYRWNGLIKHVVHKGWADWFDFILHLSSRDTRFRTVYAHNGGGWDWLSLLEFLLQSERFRFWKIEGQRVQSKIVVLRVHVERHEAGRPDGKRTRFALRFADSLYLLRSKLDTLATKFLGAGKVDLDSRMAWEVFDADKPLFYRYLSRDCESLLLVLEKTLSLLRDNVAAIDSLGLTIGSTALKIWRTGFVKKVITIPFHKDVKEFLRQGYRGGRVEVFQYGKFDNLRVYDINSLYPTSMRDAKLPTSYAGDWTSVFRWKLPGVYDISFDQHNRSIPPVLMYNGTGVYSGRGTYYIPEIALLLEVSPHSIIRLHRGYCFHEAKDNPFSDYVSVLYNLRLANRDSAVDLLAKYLLNSLYGKLAQRGERDQYLVFSDAKEFAEALRDPTRSIRELNLDLGTCVETVKTDVKFEHVGIAGTVTSYSRVLLYRGLLAAGINNVIYCDTDSIHTTGNLPDSMVSKQLGDFKLEFSGAGVYAGRKLYGLLAADGKEKIRAKGVSVGGRNGHDLRYANLLEIVEGKSIVCRFKKPATANEVISGKKSCMFMQRQRTIRMTGQK